MKRLIWAVMTIFLTACSDETLFESNLSSSAVALDLPAPGQTLKRGDLVAVSLKVNNPKSTADTLVQTLISSSGEVLESISSPVFPDKPLKPFIFDQPSSDSPKVLTLRMELFQKGSLLYRTDWPFFTTPKPLPTFFIQSHPQEIYPGSTVLLEAVPSSPFPPGTWLRWKLDKKVLQEGLADQDLTLLLWQAPVTEGMYNITAEVFPLPPGEGSRYSFSSAHTVGSRLVVTALESPEAKDFQPDSLFSHLFHFRGNLRDTGYVFKGTQAKGTGPLRPGVFNGFFGYEFKNGASVEIPAQPFPADRERNLDPFSIILRGLTKPKGSGGGTIVTMSDSGLGLESKLSYWPGKGFSFVMNQGSVRVESVLPATLKPGVSFLLTLSFLPGEQTSRVLWYLDGNQIKADTLKLSAPEGLTDKGSLVIGGNGGFEGIIDEIGILTKDSAGRPSVDPYAFSRSLKEKLAGDLEFAEGFDGLNLPLGAKTQGSPLVSLGNLVLTPGSSVSIPPIYPSAPWWDVEMQWTLGQGARGEMKLFLGHNQAPSVTLSTTGAVTAGSSHFTLPPFSQSYQLRLTFTPTALRGQIRGQTIFQIPYDPSQGLIWQWSNPGKDPGNWTIPWFYIKKSFNSGTEVN